jgi:sec-independent protein translocase protein TatB
MLDFGWTELLVIAVVAIVVIGPKDLPRVMRTVGQWSGKMKRTAREFQGQFNEALREAELDTVKRQVQEIGKIDPVGDIRKEMAKAEAGIKKDLAVKLPDGGEAAKAKPAPAEPAKAEPAITEAAKAEIAKAAPKAKAPARPKTAKPKTTKPRTAKPKAAKTMAAEDKTAGPATPPAAPAADVARTVPAADPEPVDGAKP